MSLPIGKLPPEILTVLLAHLPAPPEVIVGARPGEDAAVIEVDGLYLVIASDPVTLSHEPGALAVQVNANDIAVMGAEPRWLLASILLPTSSTRDTAERVMTGLRQGCQVLNVALIGGHTEITSSVTQVVVAATMIGDVQPDRLVTSSGAQPGDALLLAGAVAVEGTAILAREHARELRARGVSEDVIREGAALLDRPGISVLPAARALTEAVLPHAMHDPTEGGLLSAVREMALASGVGIRLDAERVPVHWACDAISRALELDPLGLLASGSLLAAVHPSDLALALQALRGEGILAEAIGEMQPEAEGLVLRRGRREEALPAVERDELARFLS